MILLTLLSTENNFKRASIITPIILILSLLVLLYLIYSYKNSIKLKNHKHIKIWAFICLIIFSISMYNSTISIPKAENTYTYLVSKKSYDKYNYKHSIRSKKFSLKYIDKSPTNINAYNIDTTCAPHKKTMPKWNIGYDV